MASGRPVYNPSPAIQTALNQGTMSAPANASSFRSWDDALRGDANLRTMPSDEARTNYLRAVYGLPNTYKLQNGRIVDAHGYLARNLHWIGPLAIFGAGAVDAFIGAGAASQGAASSVLPSSSLPVADLMGGPPSIASQGVSSGLPYMPGGGGSGTPPVPPVPPVGEESLMSKVLTNLKKYGPPVIAAGATYKGIKDGPPEAENQLSNIIKMAEGRVQASEPLFQALNAMAQAQMPTYTKNRG